MFSVPAQIARRDFSSKTLRLLSRKGIEMIGVQALPDFSTDLPCANADRGYVVSDNGTGRVLTFRQVLAAASAQ